MSQEFLTQFGESLTYFVGFLIFFFVMKKWAWKPYLNLVETRQKEIEAGFEDIRRRQAEAEKLHQEYAGHLKQIEVEARAKIQDAVAEGRRVAVEVTEAAHAEARKIVERAERNMQIELEKARIELREEIVNMTIGASERLLRQKLDDAEQRRQVSLFVQDLETKNSAN